MSQPLPEAERQFLWDAEHRGLELTQYGWGPFRSALAAADSANMTGALPEDFRAQLPTAWDRVQVEVPTLSVSRDRDAATVSQSLGGDEFVDWLLGLRGGFASPPRTKFKLLAIKPTDRSQPSGTWEGRGRLTLLGESAEENPNAVRIYLDFVTCLPERERLECGAWLQSCRVVRVDRARADHLLMTDVTQEWGIELTRLHDNWTSQVQPVNTGGAYLCDYNRDGCIDLLVTEARDFDGMLLYQGQPGGGFVDMTIKARLPSVPGTIDAIFADLDDDGWEDLILPGLLVLRNEEGRRFQSVTDRSNLDELIFSLGGEDGLTSLSGVSVVDYDRDGLTDLYVTRADALAYNQGSWIDGKSGEALGNQLLRNRGDWQFEDVTVQTRSSGDQRSVFTSVWLDANNDRWPDVYIIHEFGTGLLLVNQEGRRFRAVELDERSSDFGSMGLSCGDFDNDGWIDLYVSNMYSSAGNRVMDNLPPGFYDETISHKLRRMVSGNQLHRNLGDLNFEGVARRMDVARVGWGWGPAITDLNNDGWLDIYATCGFMSRDRRKPDG